MLATPESRRIFSGECVGGGMNVENEGESIIPFIDEGEEEESEEKFKGQYNLTITRNYQNKTRRVEISKILHDVEPMNQRSLSPIAPLVYESDTDGGKSELAELTGAEFELTIKNNNSVIKIQGFDNKSTITFNASKSKGENVYDFLSKEVDKIFKKPEREEIERAVRSINEKRKLKPICRRKRNTWKAFAKSLVGFRSGRSSQRRGSIERYPKMVLLQDPKPTQSKEETYPKMVLLDGKKDTQKRSLKQENEEIEKSKTDLDRGKKFLHEEKKILKKKKEAMEDEKINMWDNTANERFRNKEMDILAEEKLCAELEKQLLGEEKGMLKEEMDFLKEKEALQKEKDLLGEERKSCDCDDMKSRCDIKQLPPQQQHSLDAEDLCYTSVPPFHCQYPTHCLYIPVYNRTLPYYHHNEICCSGRVDPLPPFPQKHSSTQTDPEMSQQIETLDSNRDKDMDLPFGILSSFFPRIVVMKSFQEEVSSDDAQIFEIPKTENPPENEKEDEKGCEESEPVQFVNIELDKEPEELNGSTTEEHMTLTKIGYSMYDKLNELAMERKREAEESAMESEEVEVVETEKGISPGDVTLELNNRAVTLTLRDENLNFEITDKAIVRKRDLWHPSNGDNRRSGDTPRGSDQISVSVSDNRSVIITVRVGEERKWTREAKVGTDDIDIVGGDFTSREGTDTASPSPRTDNALRALQDKLEQINGRKKNREFKFPGFFLIHPFDSRYRSFPSDDWIMARVNRKPRKQEETQPIIPKHPFQNGERRKEVSTGEAREYYCEECLATMRLIEDENPTVKTMIDKFERIIHLGSD